LLPLAAKSSRETGLGLNPPVDKGLSHSLGHFRTHAPQQSVGLFDHLVVAGKEAKRNRKAKLLRGL
jgi:hypothetical protein